MYFARLKAAVRSLRFRLMLWNAGAVVLTGLAVLISLRAGVRYALIDEMDQVLDEDLQEIVLSLRQHSDSQWSALLEQLDRKAQGHKYHGWFVQFFDRQGRQVWASINSPAELTIPVSQAATGPKTFENYRLAFRELPAGSTQAAQACVGCSQDFVSRDMAQIDRLVLLCGGIVLLVSPLGGYLLAIRATRPLLNTIQMTARLRPQELHERLPIRGSGDELDHLAVVFNSLLDRIAKYLDQKRDFLANAAHELRTPLAAIRSTVEVALGGERTVEEYNELLAEVIDQCAALESLVNQLLLLAETESDRLKIHEAPAPLDQLVRKAIEMFQGVAEYSGIQLRAGYLSPLMIEGNRHHLRQVLNNLLDNAIKFTASKYQISGDTPEPVTSFAPRASGAITIWLDRKENQAVLRIRDNGPGIASEHLPHVFERFYRASRSRERDGLVDGAGLGLSICQAIVEAHGGQITVHSQPGEGTTFTVYLPLAKESLQTATVE